jgi:hypothetical protein
MSCLADPIPNCRSNVKNCFGYALYGKSKAIHGHGNGKVIVAGDAFCRAGVSQQRARRALIEEAEETERKHV